MSSTHPLPVATRQRIGAARARQIASKLKFLHVRFGTAGTRDPAEILVSDALADYAEEVAPTTASPWRIGAVLKPLTAFWEGRAVVEVTKEAYTCRGLRA